MKEGANMADVKTNEAEMYYEQEGFEAKNEVEIDFQKSGGPYHLFIQSDISENGTDLATMAVYKDEELIYYETSHSEDEVSYYYLMKNLKDTIEETAPEYLDEKIYEERYGRELAVYENILSQSQSNYLKDDYDFEPKDEIEISFQKDGGPYKVFGNTFFNDDHVEMQRLGAYKNDELIQYGEYHAEDDYHYCQFMRKIGLDLKESSPELLDEAKLHEDYSNYGAMGKEIEVSGQHLNSKYKLREFYDKENNQILLVTFNDDKYVSSAQFSAADTLAKDKYLENYKAAVTLEAENLNSEKEKEQKNFINNLQDRLRACSDPRAVYEIEVDANKPTSDDAYIIKKSFPGQKTEEYSMLVNNKGSVDLFVKTEKTSYENIADGDLSKVVNTLAHGRKENISTAAQQRNDDSKKTNLSKTERIKTQIKSMLQKGFDRVGITKYMSKKTGVPMKNIAALVYKSAAEMDRNNSRGR